MLPSSMPLSASSLVCSSSLLFFSVSCLFSISRLSLVHDFVMISLLFLLYRSSSACRGGFLLFVSPCRFLPFPPFLMAPFCFPFFFVIPFLLWFLLASLLVIVSLFGPVDDGDCQPSRLPASLSHTLCRLFLACLSCVWSFCSLSDDELVTGTFEDRAFQLSLKNGPQVSYSQTEAERRRDRQTDRQAKREDDSQTKPECVQADPRRIDLETSPFFSLSLLFLLALPA